MGWGGVNTGTRYWVPSPHPPLKREGFWTNIPPPADIYRREGGHPITYCTTYQIIDRQPWTTEQTSQGRTLHDLSAESSASIPGLCTRKRGRRTCCRCEMTAPGRGGQKRDYFTGRAPKSSKIYPFLLAFLVLRVRTWVPQFCLGEDRVFPPKRGHRLRNS